MKKSKLIITCGDNWNGFQKKEYDLSGFEEQKDFVFKLDDRYIFEGVNTCSDGPVFSVVVEYANSTASRKEQVSLIPVKGD
jgi:hypothetical protein